MGKGRPTCGTCDDTGWVVRDVAGVARACRCDQCDYWARKRGQAPGVPADLQQVRLRFYGTVLKVVKGADVAIQHAQHCVDGIHPSLYIHGAVGCGKTTLACAVLNDLWDQGLSVRFFRVPELLLQLQPGFDQGTVLWYQVVDTPVLALDDVASGQATDFARRTLQMVCDARQDRGHRTIWTSNLTLDELAEFMAEDKRLPSRIAGQAKVVELVGPDYRLRKKP